MEFSGEALGARPRRDQDVRWYLMNAMRLVTA